MRSLPSYFGLILFLQFLTSVFTFASPLLAPLLMTLGQLSPSHAAWVQCAAYLLVGIFQPIIGNRVDHGKLGEVLLLGSICFGGGILIFLYNETSFALLLFGVVCPLFLRKAAYLKRISADTGMN